MKILLTGGKGMLGRTLISELTEFEVIPTDLPEGDITNFQKFNCLLSKKNPDVIIHCAAMTAVDQCETDRETAELLNVKGSENVAKAAALHNMRIIAISTDYVFDGTRNRPYNEEDLPNGGSTVYGQTKFAGEEMIRKYSQNHIIARVSWLYGKGGPSFVHTMLRLADGTRPALKVVNDQHGNPTSTLAVANALRELLKRPGLKGTFHLTCEGEATWYEFACEIFKTAKIHQAVIPCTSEEYKTPAKRPGNSRLEKMMLRKYGLSPMPHWKDALKEFFEKGI